MKKSVKIFWIVFAVYSVLTVIGTLVIEHYQNNLGFLIDMKGYIPLMKYYTLLGLVLFLIAFFSMLRSRARNRREIHRLEEQKRELKATLYDLRRQEGEQPRAGAPPAGDEKSE